MIPVEYLWYKTPARQNLYTGVPLYYWAPSIMELHNRAPSIMELPLLLKYTIEACVHPSSFFLGNMSAQVHVYICVYISFKHKIHEELSLTFREKGRKLIKLQIYRNALIYTKLSILLHIVCVAVLYCRTSLKCF